MARIVILGGYGYTGRLLAAHLLERSATEIVLAGRHLDKAQACAEELNAGFRQNSPVYTGPQPAGQRVSAIRADAASMQDLRLALAGSETHWLVDWVITPIVFAGLKLAPRHGLRPLGKLMWWGMQNLPKPLRLFRDMEAMEARVSRRIQV